MKILLLLSALPDKNGEAIDVVSNEFVNELAKAGHEVLVQVLYREYMNEKSQNIWLKFKNLFSSNSKVIPLDPIILPTLDGYLKKINSAGYSGPKEAITDVQIYDKMIAF